jgi:hypothetical protein
MAQIDASERFTTLPVKCIHCGQAQIVKMRVRPGVLLALGPQRLECLNCKTMFDVVIPDQIIGGPYLPS